MSRFIFVGDVHGCIGELRQLTSLLDPHPSDRVIAVGDLVAKGPDSAAVLRHFIAHGWDSVLGNQDARLLERAKEGPLEDAPELSDAPALLAWLRARPDWIDLPEADALVVHGGVLPGTPVTPEVLRAQRATLRTLRFLRRGCRGDWEAVAKGAEREGDRFWGDLWDGPRTILYGHSPTSEKEPRVRAQTIGLDTGCVYGGRLTAAVLEDRTWSFVSVPSERVWRERKET